MTRWLDDLKSKRGNIVTGNLYSFNYTLHDWSMLVHKLLYSYIFLAIQATDEHEHQAKEAEEGETSSEDDEEGEADRDESDAELSDVEERKYCDFSSRENIEMNLELKCVTSEKMKELYRNTERVSKILLCNLI